MGIGVGVMVLYNIKNNKNKKKGGWGLGARFDPKPSQVGEKDKKEEKSKKK